MLRKTKLVTQAWLTASTEPPQTFTKQTMKNTSYTVEFFHGIEGIWKSATVRTFTDREAARTFMTAQSEMCGGAVAFRIEEIAQ